MTRVLTLVAAVSLCLVVLVRADAAGQGAPGAVFELSAAEQRAVVDCIMEGRGIEKTLRANGRVADANELAAMLSDLQGRRYSRARNPLADTAYAYVYSKVGLETIHLMPVFFDITKLDRALPAKPSVDYRRMARLEQLSFLIHEWKHTQYKTVVDFGRPESEAYQLQYKWLRIFGVADDDGTVTLGVVRRQLALEGVEPQEFKPADVPDATGPRIKTMEEIRAEIEKARLAPPSSPALAKCEADYQAQVSEITANTQWNYSGLASWSDGCPEADRRFTACYQETCRLYRDSGIGDACTEKCRESFRLACTAENLGIAATRRDQCVARNR